MPEFLKIGIKVINKAGYIPLLKPDSPNKTKIPPSTTTVQPTRFWNWHEAMIMIVAFFPYQWLLSVGALRAVFHFIQGRSNWEKTARIDYIVTDSPMLREIEHLHGNMELVNKALQNASLVAEFRPNTFDQQYAMQIHQVNHIFNNRKKT